MRKIDKSCDLSSEYKKWEEGLEAKQEAHPKYNSSQGEYYLDIIMQLFRCQDGLCAYTERRLCSKKFYDSENWENGKYTGAKPHANIEGQLDHFDPSLKSKKADAEGKQDWLWSNFFMVQSDINTKVKGSKTVDSILKPDKSDFASFRLLDYDVENHLFIPNFAELDSEAAERVEKMLKILGVNYFNEYRGSFLQDKLRPVYLYKEKLEDIVVQEFPTAFEMCKRKIENGEMTWDEFLSA